MSIPPQTMLRALAIEQILSEGGKAFHVRTPNGKTGWIPKSQLHEEDVGWLHSLGCKAFSKPVQVDIPLWLYEKWHPKPERSDSEVREKAPMQAPFVPPLPPQSRGRSSLPPSLALLPSVEKDTLRLFELASEIQGLVECTRASGEQIMAVLLYHALFIAGRYDENPTNKVFEMLMKLHVEIEKANLRAPRKITDVGEALEHAGGYFYGLFSPSRG